MELRYFYIFALGSAFYYFSINGFIVTKYLSRIIKVRKSASVLQAKGFSKEEKQPKLSKDAAKYLK